MNKRAHIHIPTNLADLAADKITSFVGSWLCIEMHLLWFVVWLIRGLDINLLTLIVSLEAIFLSTLVMISQNRQADRDKSRDDLEASEVDALYQINQKQLEILQLLHKRNEV